MIDLSKKVAIVTGSGAGLGAAIALALGRAGARLILAVRNVESGERTARAILAGGGAAIVVECDVANYAAVESMTATAVERFGAIDILINNAGVIAPIAPLDQSDANDWRRSIEVNLVGAYHCTRSIVPTMLRRRSGTIVSLSSNAARKPFEGWSAYCAAKAGLAMLSRSIDLEFGARGIRAISVTPGAVDTAMQTAIRASGINPVSQLAPERLVSPDVPARAVLWLCSDAAAGWRGREVDVHDPEFIRAAAESQSPG